MAEHSKIEWCDHTFNPWIGCTKVSPGCYGCYAERSAPVRVLRSRRAEPWGPDGSRYRTNGWGDPLRWDKRHDAFFAEHGRRQRVFCASLADVFDNQVPEAWRFDLLNLIADTPNLDWLLLTKRIGNVQAMLDAFVQSDGHRGERWDGWSNVWIGATVVNQAEADRDIPKLLAVPARVRFLSVEPMLSRIYLEEVPDPIGGVCLKPFAGLRWLPNGMGRHETVPAGGRIDWVICGGESGPMARAMNPAWVRSLRDQCAAAGVPFLFKQWGEWLPWSHFEDSGIDDDVEQTRFTTGEWRDDDRCVLVGKPTRWAHLDCEIDGAQCVGRVGKAAAGRLLDGRTHDAFPTT